MFIDKIEIKNFGDIDSLCMKFDKKVNIVSLTVGYAIAVLINNKFAERRIKEIPFRENTYLSMVFRDACDIKYTAVKNGDGEVKYTVLGEELNEEQVMKIKTLTRPYRQDNLALFMATEKEDFLDYVSFMPLYISKVPKYKDIFKHYIADILELERISENKPYYLRYNDEKGFSLLMLNRKGLYNVKRAGESDVMQFRYNCFLKLVRFLDMAQARVGEESAYTPLIVVDLLSFLDCDPANNKTLYKKSDSCGRQVFFVEEFPEKIKVFNF